MNGQPMEPPFPTRTARIGSVCIISAAQSTVVQFGDRGETKARLIALALQRQEDHTTSGDIFFESYHIFFRDLPSFHEPDSPMGNVAKLERINCEPNITVGCLKVTASGSSASIQAGNGKRLTGESRIKHIRQYPRPSPVPPLVVKSNDMQGDCGAKK
ncbi:spore germination protein GerPE [Paenibacillus sp. N4]|uniref:spore germination protein GerPE n=1 Tax=Paenibacillus vietnamensis TaxID=2590547 RepID=UPI001CD061AB|nr:spore germination protein GerPE [Paenibacillus vietnamensis]MCA0754552.1 spore germination protein GerPE [Paenibacillus vietnamensis]